MRAARQAARPTRCCRSASINGRNIWRTDLDGRARLAGAASHEQLRRSAVDRARRARCCTCRSISTASRSSTPRCAPGSRSRCRSSTSCGCSRRRCNDGRDAGRRRARGQRAPPSQRAAASPRVQQPGSARRRCAKLDAAARPRATAPMRSAHRSRPRVLKLPQFPTTTIGSFPQTAEIRQRAQPVQAPASSTTPPTRRPCSAEIARSVREQEALGLDVLVHGEAERNDMVEYFGEQLDGFAFSQYGWVQSYGSRCVKPPIIFGDVSRPKPMTVEWIALRAVAHEQADEGHADRPGDDPAMVVRARRPAALGRPASRSRWRCATRCSTWSRPASRIIQIDEPALREGPAAAPVAVAGVPRLGGRVRSASPPTAWRDETQIHTHMCYSEFNDIIASIAGMDADVITIETSRSDMELLDAFGDFRYPNEIGPGVYDIHSPRVPSAGGHRAADAQGGRAYSGRATVGQSRLRPEDARHGPRSSRRWRTWWRRPRRCARRPDFACVFPSTVPGSPGSFLPGFPCIHAIS